MSSSRLDFAIVGNTPQARLLAGLLASVHGKSVLLQGESQSSFRLARGLDLSVGAITRPETWSLLHTLVPETRRIISRAGGRRSWSRIDPIFFADGPAAREALGHVRQMAAAFGIAAERVPPKALGPEREGIVLRDAVLLHRPPLERALDSWLAKAGVQRLDDGAALQIAPDGSAVVTSGEEPVSVGHVVLVGDEAVTRYLPEAAWPPILAAETTSTILTEPTPPISSPVMHQLDTRLTLLQPAARGVSAIGPGGIDAFTGRVRDLLGSERPFRQAGQSTYRRVVTRDGGPAVGQVGGSGPLLVAGFGMAGAFFAPALARWLVGAASLSELGWIEARTLDRLAEGSLVGEAGGPQ